MLTFLLTLVLVFAMVDLLVVTIIEPLASKKKSKAIKDHPYQKNINPVISLVGATMYDGGTKKEGKKDSIEEKK